MSYRETRYDGWVSSHAACSRDFSGFIHKGIVSPTDERKSWADRYMRKADHNMDFASFVSGLHNTIIKERFPGQTFYDWVTTVYYYAVYHSALALLSNAGFRSRSHMATLCGVINCYYHDSKSLERRHVEMLGRIDKENVEQFVESQGLRERASYGTSTSFEERLAAIARNDALEFLNRVREILGR